MPGTINQYLQKIKKVCDNDTFLFAFSNGTARAYSYDILVKPIRDYLRPITEYVSSGKDPKPNALAYDNRETINGAINDNYGKTLKYIRYNTFGFWTTDAFSTKYVDKTTETVELLPMELFHVDMEGNNLYNNVVMKRLCRDPNAKVYYKGLDGRWYSYDKYIGHTDIGFIFRDLCNKDDYKDKLVITDYNLLPRCEFTDSDGYEYIIDACDGYNDENGIRPVEFIEYDTNSVYDILSRPNGKVGCTPCCIEDPHLGFDARHVFNDLEVKINPSLVKEVTTKDNICNHVLAWLNGAFVPITASKTDDNIFYIEDGMSLVDEHVKNQVLHAPKKLADDGTATVIEDPAYDEYRWNINLRLFGWKDVSVSPWYKPTSIDTIPITYKYVNTVRIISSIVFPVDINKDACLILCNGRILGRDEYEFDKENPRKVNLTKVERAAYKQLEELMLDVIQHNEYYRNVNPLKLISGVLTDSKYYSLINFSNFDKGETKSLYLKDSFACATNFPYVNEMTFSTINHGDLITVGGLFTPFEWTHKNTICIPKSTYTYNAEGVNSIERSDVVRRYFIRK